jgi:hypothetical protein
MGVKGASDCTSQAAFHRLLFARLYEWEAVWQAALDIADDALIPAS